MAASLDSLYTYMMERLTTANQQRDAAPVAEVMRLMTGLRDAWSQIAQAPPPAAYLPPAFRERAVRMRRPPTTTRQHGDGRRSRTPATIGKD